MNNTQTQTLDHIYKSLTLLDGISPENVIDLMGKLAEYKYVYSLNQLRRGRFIRWISLHLTRDVFKLSYGGMIVDIEITDECPMILCKTPVGKMVKINFNENRVYQKLTADEKLIILCENIIERPSDNK